MSRRLAWIAALALGLAGVEARALEATLSVDPATSLTVSFDAIGTASGPVVLSGDVEVTIHVTDHPTHGTVATAVKPKGGVLFSEDIAFGVAHGTSVSLSISTTSLEAVPDGPPVAATPTGPGTAQAPLGGVGLIVNSGTASATGTALGVPVNEVLDFSVTSVGLHDDGSEVATIETSGPVGGPVDVTVTIPVDAHLLALAAPGDSRLDVPMMLQGQIVLTGTAVAASPVPAVDGPALGVVAALLLASAALVWRKRASAATATARSRTRRD